MSTKILMAGNFILGAANLTALIYDPSLAGFFIGSLNLLLGTLTLIDLQVAQ